MTLPTALTIAQSAEVVDSDQLLARANHALEDSSVVEPEVPLPTLALEAVVDVEAVYIHRDSFRLFHMVEYTIGTDVRCKHTSDCLGPLGGSTGRVNGPLTGSISLFAVVLAWR